MKNELVGPYDINFEDFNGKELVFNINISGASARGYLIIFRLQNDSFDDPIINYKSYGITGDLSCYSKQVKELDFCKREYIDSCFYIARLENEKGNFSIEYSDKDNPANKLIVKNELDINNDNVIEVFFPSSILTYIPEDDFALLYKVKDNSLKAYFSLHDDGNWYMDSVTDLNSDDTYYRNTKLKVGANYLNQSN